jgi:hypothetical protein
MAVSIIATIASRMVVAACPLESFCTIPKSGTGAIGIIRMMPYRMRSLRLSTRRSEVTVVNRSLFQDAFEKSI